MHYIKRWRVITIFLICLVGSWYGVQHFLPSRVLNALPNFLPREKVSLGLDLQGGSSILLEVDLKNLLRDSLASMLDDIRRVFRKERFRYFGLKIDRGNKIRLQLHDPAQGEGVVETLKKHFHQMKVSKTDNGEVILEPTESYISEKQESTVSQAIEIIRRRIDEMGTKEPSLQRQGKTRILLQLPGVNEPSQVKDILGQTAKLSFQLLHPTLTPQTVAGNRAPTGYTLLPGMDGDATSYLVKNKVEVSGEMLTNAGVDSQGEAKVTFSLDATGARKFAEVTQKNIGRPFAIILDEKVVSAPVIQSVIPGGRGEITGRFTLQEARNLAILLRAGALPAPLRVLEEKTVGPELGSDSIKAGQTAILFAIVAIFVFMFLFYGILFGTIANICLVFNLVFLFGGISALGATLTLPGLAGIALTLGMAVDANILIFERIREEVRDGMPPLSALSAGYDRAIATILDSNITTLIGAALLYQFGNGPVRGFSVTLALGILISMFTAISLSRLLIHLWVKMRGSQTTLPI
ncbi:MAG: protein translocase subunit SecD [Holosporaceae bacterium]|nr:MAG: protein translocase subunit SecD [Holosporaceae bacterium]